MSNDTNMASEQGIVALISGAEINQQIATAHKFPRSVERFYAKGKDLVGKTTETAQACIYALPRDGKVIEGPSARFAEIIAAAWGNCRAGARVVDDSGKFVTAQAVFHDLESNTAITYEVQRRITGKDGRRYKDDMIGVTANAACSIALRNAILKGVPKAIWQPLYDSARATAIGDVRTLTSRREQAVNLAMKMGATHEHIFATLEVKGMEEIGNEKLFELCSILQAIRDGDSTVDDAFGLNQRKPASALNERIAAGEADQPVKQEPSAPQAETAAAEPAPQEGQQAAQAEPTGHPAGSSADKRVRRQRSEAKPEPATKPPTQTVSGASVGDTAQFGDATVAGAPAAPTAEEYGSDSDFSVE